MYKRQLLTLLQVPAETWDGAADYLTVILLGIPLTMLYNMEAALLRAVGNSITPLLFLLFSTMLNIGLDAAFMGPLGLGVRGAAIATVLAQGISALLGVWYILRSYPELRFRPAQLKETTRHAVTHMFWAGLSMGLMSAIYNLVDSIYVAQVSDLDFLALSYAYPVQLMIVAFCAGLGVGFNAILAKRLGEGRLEDAVNAACHGFLLYGAVWLLALIFALVGCTPFFQSCSDNPVVVQSGIALSLIHI